MTVSRLPTPAQHPAHPDDYVARQWDSLPPALLRLLGASESVDALAVDHLPTLARQGVPEPVLESAMGWPPGCLGRWRALPDDPTMSCTARRLADLVARASAEAEAELAAALHTRGRVDPRTAQWLLERRRPERWGAGTADVAQAVRRVVQAVSSAAPDLDPAVLRQALEAAAQGGQ